MESARATVLSTSTIYKSATNSYSLRLVECESEDGTIQHKFGIAEYTYNSKRRMWSLVRSRVLMPVSVWPTLVAHGQDIIGSLSGGESTKHDQTTETTACDNIDAELHEPESERVVKVIHVACEPPHPVEKPTRKPVGRPRKRPASPDVEPPVKRADTEHAAQQ